MLKIIKKITGLFLVTMLLIMLLLPSLALADGMVMPPYDYTVREAEQKAVIFYKNGQEDLILSITFEGDASDFGWIVPIPEKPEIDKAPDEIFKNLGELTKPKKKLIEKIGDWLVGGGYLASPTLDGGPMSLKGGEEEPAVQVIDTKQVGIYDTATLKADNAEVLYEWLDEHKYQIPKHGEDILDEYIEKDWYFVAMKISGDYLTSKISGDLGKGHATPIKFSFKSNEIIYPLKISSITSEKEINYINLRSVLFDVLDEDICDEKEYNDSILSGLSLESFTKEDYENLLGRYKSANSENIWEEHYAIIDIIDDKIQNMSNEELDKLISPLKQKGEITDSLLYQTISSKYKYSDNYVDILLYVFSDHKKEVENYSFTTKYADKVKAEDIKNLAEDKSWIDVNKDFYLTKLYKYRTNPDDFTADIIIDNASDNKYVNTGAMNIIEWVTSIVSIGLIALYIIPVLLLKSSIYSGFMVTLVITAIILLVLFLVFTIRRFIKNTDRWKKLTWFIQFYTLLPLFWFLSAYFYMSAFYSYYYEETSDFGYYLFLGTFLSGFLLSILTIFIMERIRRRVKSKAKVKEDIDTKQQQEIEDLKREVDSLRRRVREE